MSEPASVQLQAFRILQANINGCQDLQRRILEQARDRYHWDVILLQEATRSSETLPCKNYGYVRIACSQKSPDPGRHVSVCVYARSNSPFGLPEPVEVRCTCADMGLERHKEHICTIALDLPDGHRLFITNIYNRHSESIPVECLTAFLNFHGQHFAALDSNLHHPIWGGGTLLPGFRPTPKARNLADRLARDLQLLTTPGVATWHRGRSYSVIDLTWATPDIQSSTPQPLEDLMFPETDHTPIQTTLLLPVQPCDTTAWRWKDADTDQLQLDMAAELKILSELPLATGANVLTRTSQVIEISQLLMLTHVPRTDRTFRSPFDIYTSEIKKLTTEVRLARRSRNIALRTAQRAWGPSRRRDPTYERAIWTPFHVSQRKWRRLQDRLEKLRKTEFERQWRSSFDHSHMSKWGWNKWSRRKGKASQPPVLPDLLWEDPETNETWLSASRSEKIDCLHKTWFSPRPDTGPPTSPEQTHGQPPRTTASSLFEPVNPELVSPLQSLTEDQLSLKFDKLRDNRAPGGDEIGPIFLKICRVQLIPFLTCLFTACLMLSYFPEVFKTGRTAPVPKPMKLGKTYNDPGMWRPICLLSCLGKLFESLIADLLAQLALENGMLPETQMAARGRSTTTALLYVLEIVRTARARGLAVSIMSLDQKGAFNHVQLEELLAVLATKGVPQWLIKLLESFLSNRQTTIRIPGYESESLPCGGIPQGSPLSPILFAFFTIGLLHNSQEDPTISTEQTTEGLIFKIAYSDDTYIITVGPSLRVTKQLLKEEFHRCQQWARKSGATFDINKTELVHFASKHQKNAQPMSSFIDGFNDAYEGSTLKILGVIIAVDNEGNLDWSKHFEYLRTKVANLEKDFKRIVKMTYGLDVVSALQVYKTCIRSAITYGSAAWYEPCDKPWYLSSDIGTTGPPDSQVHLDTAFKCRIGQNEIYASDEHRKKWSDNLDHFQNKFLRVILGAFQMTHRPYLWNELGIERLDLFVYMSAVTTRANLIETDVWKTIVHAKSRVETFAKLACPRSDMELRNRALSDSVTSTVTEEIDTRAAHWKQLATKAITLQHSTPNAMSIDDEVLGQAAADGVTQLRRIYGTLEESNDPLPPESNHTQRLKRKVRSIGQKWAQDKMEQLWNQWRWEMQETMDPSRPIPAALDNEWSRWNSKQYCGLTRPEGSSLFQLRSEYIGLMQHLREHKSTVSDGYCRKCDQHYLETVTHLLHFCPALNAERLELYRSVWPDDSWLSNIKHVRSSLIHKAPAQVARFALSHFPNEQFDWTRRHMLDLMLSA